MGNIDELMTMFMMPGMMGMGGKKQKKDKKKKKEEEDDGWHTEEEEIDNEDGVEK